MKQKVETVLQEISKKAGKPPADIKSATDTQGLFINCKFAKVWNELKFKEQPIFFAQESLQMQRGLLWRAVE